MGHTKRTLFLYIFLCSMWHGIYGNVIGGVRRMECEEKTIINLNRGSRRQGCLVTNPKAKAPA